MDSRLLFLIALSGLEGGPSVTLRELATVEGDPEIEDVRGCVNTLTKEGCVEQVWSRGDECYRLTNVGRMRAALENAAITSR